MLAFTLLLSLALDAALVTSHATHSGQKASQDRLTSSLNDALLSYLCRGKNGLQCSGHGQCSGGMCACDRGYSGMKCDINSADMPPVMPPPSDLPSMLPGELPPVLPGEMPPVELPGNLPPSAFPGDIPPQAIPGDIHASPSFLTTRFPFEPLVDRQKTSSTEAPLASDPIYCTVQDESICSGHGLCQGGRCVCDQGYSGTICELSSDVGFCKTYKECAECTAFMIPCPEKCSKMGSFYLVYGFPDTGSPLWTCRYRSSKFQCMFYFQREYEDSSGYKSIQVVPCLDYRKLADSNTTTEEPFTTTIMTTSTQSTTTSTTTVTHPKTKAPSTATTTTASGKDDSASDRKKAQPGSGSVTISLSALLFIASLFLLSL